VEEGENLQVRHSHVGPSGKQEYSSSFLIVEESEIGGQCFILERCCHWGVLLSLTVVGIVRMTRWGLAHWGPSGEGRRSLRRTRSPGLTEIVTGPLRGWAGSCLPAVWEVPRGGWGKVDEKVSAKGCIFFGIQILWNPVTPKTALSCFYGMGKWETEDWFDLHMTQRVSLSL
jgi:hypothetical protein